MHIKSGGFIHIQCFSSTESHVMQNDYVIMYNSVFIMQPLKRD